MVEVMNDGQRAEAAIRTLEAKGYTFHGAEYWRPPLGKNVSPLLDRIHRLEGLLFLADEALMELNCGFPCDEVTPEQRRLKEACEAIREITGEDFRIRKGRAAVARAVYASKASPNLPSASQEGGK